MQSRREYLIQMRVRYLQAQNRMEKSRILDELQETLGYARKYAITVMKPGPLRDRPPAKRTRPIRYQAALPVIQIVWEALDYPCAERLHPVLPDTAKQLERHGEVTLTPQIIRDLQRISRATLGRRIATWTAPGAKTSVDRRPSTKLRSEVPVDRYKWNETRPGALEVDLVEHNGGSSSGHFACTLSVVDVVTGYSRRFAVLGRGRTGIVAALEQILAEWPYAIWGVHSDNGAEFMNDHLLHFTKTHQLSFTRSRPYKKNDNAHVEQKNRFLVRDVVGYARYDTSEQVTWLNTIYAWLDVYANACLPMRKVVQKLRHGSHVKKTYDTARTPLQRAFQAGVVPSGSQPDWQQWMDFLNPLQLHRQLQTLLAQGPEGVNVAQPPMPAPVPWLSASDGAGDGTQGRD